MNILLFLAPASVFLALMGLGAFWWTVRSGQYEDPLGDSSRILDDHLSPGPGLSPPQAKSLDPDH